MFLLPHKAPPNLHMFASNFPLYYGQLCVFLSVGALQSITKHIYVYDNPHPLALPIFCAVSYLYMVTHNNLHATYSKSTVKPHGLPKREAHLILMTFGLCNGLSLISLYITLFPYVHLTELVPTRYACFTVLYQRRKPINRCT